MSLRVDLIPLFFILILRNLGYPNWLNQKSLLRISKINPTIKRKRILARCPISQGKYSKRDKKKENPMFQFNSEPMNFWRKNNKNWLKFKKSLTLIRKYRKNNVHLSLWFRNGKSLRIYQKWLKIGIRIVHKHSTINQRQPTVKLKLTWLWKWRRSQWRKKWKKWRSENQNLKIRSLTCCWIW